MRSCTPVPCAAEDLVRRHLRRLDAASAAVAKFETGRGRRLVLNLGLQDIGLFLERYPGDGAIDGVKMNPRSPGHYSAESRRPKWIGRDARLGAGNDAFDVRCDSLDALDRLLVWYISQ